MILVGVQGGKAPVMGYSLRSPVSCQPVRTLAIKPSMTR